MLIIKLNDLHFTEQCPSCSQTHEVLPGPELYDSRLNRAVCWDCGVREEPALAALLLLGQIADTYSNILIRDRHNPQWEQEVLGYQEKLFRAANHLACHLLPEGPDRDDFTATVLMLDASFMQERKDTERQRFDVLLQGVDLSGEAK